MGAQGGPALRSQRDPRGSATAVNSFAAPDVAERREGADMFGKHRVADLEAVANGREFYFGHSGQHGHQPQPGRRVQVGIQLKHQWPITSSASPASARAEMTTSHPAASPRA